MMWKLIFLVLVIWFAISIFKKVISQPKKHASDKTSKDIIQENETENMVQCASCAVHLPRSEAYLVDGNFYCCQVHIKTK